MFSRRRWSFSTNGRTESPNHRKDGLVRPRHHDSSRDRKRMVLIDLDFPITDRHNTKIAITETSKLGEVAGVLKKRFPDGDRRVPEDAEILFFHVDKPLNGDDIPKKASTLLYRVLPAGDDGTLRAVWRGNHLKLRRNQIETITQEAKNGQSVGSIRDTVANLLRMSNETKDHLVKSANQILVKAGGGLRPGPLQGSSWEARKVQTWLCRYLIIDIRPPGDYYILRGFNEQYIWHKPYRNSRGYADVYMLKHWLKHEILASVHHRGIHRRGIDTGDIRLTCRGRLIGNHSHILPGETIDFEVPRGIEDSFVRAEAWLVPASETCIVCSDEKRVSEMPNKRRITESCEHDTSICKECVGQWIASSMDNVIWDRLRCPECPQFLKYENIRAFATRDTFDRYDTLAMKDLLSNLPEFAWCLNSACNSGQIYPRGCERGRCQACKHQLCVRHKVPWHSGEDCDEYEKRARRQRKNDKASEQHVKETTKPCPGCKRNIHKFSGCDHITCVCGFEWCWLCSGDYYRDERSFLQCHHTRQCQYYEDPPNYEGGRAFMPFLDIDRPMPPGRMAHNLRQRAEAAAQARAGNRPPAPLPAPDQDLVNDLMAQGRPRNPFDPNGPLNPARPLHPPRRPNFVDRALLADLGRLLQHPELDD
ncbi:hypothetical protein F4677DRAFT_347709 [Hypoxylon crocopeplum]|nr:hypothetical protein F4677DRAFT_347709 [Hypoxylon crocopeplum]